MIISTSSQSVQLTDDICEYVEDTLRKDLGDVAGQVVSVDARLEAVRSVRDRVDMKAVMRVDLRNHRALVTEIQDNDLYAAIRRGAADSARAIERQLEHSRQVNGQRTPYKFHVFGRYPAANV
jgi:ribosomal subunit interface protein